MAPHRRLAAIMFTDMVGYTALTQADEAGTLRLLREEEAIVRPFLRAHSGREVKSTGDGFLVEFDSALHAVQCAIEIHERLRERNSQSGVARIALRIGVHLGDVEEREGDIFGDAVNIAARIQPLAAPEGVCITGQVFDQVRNKLPHRFAKLGPKVLKNVLVPTDVYRVIFPGDPSPPAGEGAALTRLAVLPLANISPDPKDEYIADGLTEELISVLSGIRGLRVIARTSVSQYKSGGKPVSQIGAELGVGAVLEGSVRKAGNRLRITLQLIDVATEEHIWANSYDRDLGDVFALQSEIAEKTAGTLRLELLGPEGDSLRRRPAANLAAYELYLKGIHAERLPFDERSGTSAQFFEGAIARDPNFSLAYSHLANTLLFQVGEILAPRQAFPRVQGLVAKALELNPNSSDAHTARGNLALQYDHDWALAETEFERALALNPSDAEAHFWYGVLLTALQRFAEAFEQFRAAIELDPLWEHPQGWLWQAYAWSGNPTAAIAALEELRESKPQNPAVHASLGLFYLLAGRVPEARLEAEFATLPTERYARFNRALLRAKLGSPEEARALLAELETASQNEYVAPTLIAGLYATLGERDTALGWLERNNQPGESGLWLEYPLLAFDPIRDTPRFQALLRALQLPVRTGASP